MKIHAVAPGSEAWCNLRATRPTASEFNNLIKLNGEAREGEMRQTYLATKVAEVWLGGPLPGFETWDTEQGKLLEEHAIPYYELEYREEVKRVGFITTDDERVGCSPDGILSGAGLEIKCLQSVHHTKCLLDGKLPNCFKAQIYASLYVTGLPEWKLLLYSRRFPRKLFTIPRDEEIMENIHVAVSSFLHDVDAAIGHLKWLNGGRMPPKRTNLNPERVKFSWEEQDEITP